MTYVPDLSEKEGMEMPSQSYSVINLSCTGAFVFCVQKTRAFNLSPEGSKDKVQKTLVCVDKLKAKLF